MIRDALWWLGLSSAPPLLSDEDTDRHADPSVSLTSSSKQQQQQPQPRLHPRDLLPPPPSTAVAGGSPSSSPPAHTSATDHASRVNQADDLPSVVPIQTAAPTISTMSQAVRSTLEAAGPTCQIRVLLRGARGSGKTTLFRRLQGLEPLPYEPTDAIQAATIIVADTAAVEQRQRTASQSHRAVTSIAALPGSFPDSSEPVAGSSATSLWSAWFGASGGPTPSSASSSPSTMDATLLPMVKVELWDVVDRGTARPLAATTSYLDADFLSNAVSHRSSNHNKKPTDSASSVTAMLSFPTDATTVDVYRHAHAVLFLVNPLDRTTFAYVEQEIRNVPKHLPIAVILNFQDKVLEALSKHVPSSTTTTTGAEETEEGNELENRSDRMTNRSASSSSHPRLVSDDEVRDLLRDIGPARTPYVSRWMQETGRLDSGHYNAQEQQQQYLFPPLPHTLLYVCAKSAFGVASVRQFFDLPVAMLRAMTQETVLLNAYAQLEQAAQRVLQTASRQETYQAHCQEKEWAQQRLEEQEREARLLKEQQLVLSQQRRESEEATTTYERVRAPRSSLRRSATRSSSTSASLPSGKPSSPASSQTVLPAPSVRLQRVQLTRSDDNSQSSCLGEGIDASFFTDDDEEGEEAATTTTGKQQQQQRRDEEVPNARRSSSERPVSHHDTMADVSNSHQTVERQRSDHGAAAAAAAGGGGDEKDDETAYEELAQRTADRLQQKRSNQERRQAIMLKLSQASVAAVPSSTDSFSALDGLVGPAGSSSTSSSFAFSPNSFPTGRNVAAASVAASAPKVEATAVAELVEQLTVHLQSYPTQEQELSSGSEGGDNLVPYKSDARGGGGGGGVEAVEKRKKESSTLLLDSSSSRKKRGNRKKD